MKPMIRMLTLMLVLALVLPCALAAKNTQIVVEFLQRLIGDPVKIGIDLGHADVKEIGDLVGGQGLVKMLDQILYHVKNIVVRRVETVGDSF